jgi:3-dehydroquinate synthase
MHMTDSLLISSQQWDYEATFHETIDSGVRSLGEVSDVFVVVDSRILALFGDQLSQLTSRFPTLSVDASEETKSLIGVGSLVEWLISKGAVRSSTILAIGGGCIQDLVSFTAHIYYRGVNWLFLPTTVLSQADSCIGAKSGINFLPFKNQLGALHSPRQVVICSEFLKTLPDVELASGYGEIVKLSVTSTKHFLEFLEVSLSEGGIRNSNLLLLERASLIAKQEIIEEDEYESDLRRILNYGHSFGHALETLAGHQIPHGLAVLWGIDVINALGVRWGLTPAPLAHRIHRLIKTHFDYSLPLVPSADDLVSMLAKDKKNANGLMHFAVLLEEGKLIIEPRALDAHLTKQVEEVLREERVFSRS